MKDWKQMLAIIYAVICVFDFIMIPVWFGITRATADFDIIVNYLLNLEPSVQIAVINALTFQHEPLTLKGGGLFHLAFGALLTGSAIVGNRQQKD